jgi:predicted nucleotidyltransferase
MNIPNIDDIIKASKLHPSRIFNIYLFGSLLYGTHEEEVSDYDVIMVANNSVEAIEIKGDLYNIHIYTPDKFKADLDWHRINNLECIFAPDWARLKENIDYKSGFKLNKNKLRHSISHISSNSWVKAKKKLLDGEYRTGIKSLFHSIRIPIFAIQIAKSGTINDFSAGNYIWERLKEKNWTAEELQSEFKNEHNSILSQFRKYFPFVNKRL